MTSNNKYRSIFISDLHLGSRAFQAEEFCKWIKNNTCDQLYLVGDIIDFWKLRRNVYWPQSHSNALRRILTASKRNTQIYYVIGNHDEELRDWLTEHVLSFGNIQFANQFDHILVNGQKFLVTHGDLFDGVVRYHKWLSLIGDHMYSMLLWFNEIINKLRRLFGKEYWSFSGYIKTNTKQAVAFITKFEEYLEAHARAADYDGVICGHIHTPSLYTKDAFTYINTGDWCETISAVVEHHNGLIELLVWNNQTNSLEQHTKWMPV
jgi:UDP-2,3-diacylglucosamine pyrophosphatase LpxH